MEIKTFDFESFEDFEQSNESLQRNEEWQKARSGRWTGSKNKDLMNCGRSTSKSGFVDNSNKVFDFGATAEKHVFKVGKERLTGLRSMEISAKQLEYGTKSEPLLIDQLLKDGIITDFEEKGFENFPNYENGGASVDGIAKAGPNIPKHLDLKVGEEICLELKCCVSWDGFYTRTYEKVNEKHGDFWQHQSEMLSVNMKKLLYVVALPMQTEKYEMQVVEASPIHQEALLKRCLIADKAIEYWEKYTYSQALQMAIAEFQDEKNSINDKI